MNMKIQKTINNIRWGMFYMFTASFREDIVVFAFQVRKEQRVRT
jgi:hypothetical protein